MSAPPVRIESKAWTDTRYTALALELGLAPGDADVALIRCAAIWRWQTEHYTDAAPTYVVDRSVVNGALKSLRGADALVAATLAELQPDGRLRIRGGVDDKGKSRIDWLWKEREKNRAKGHARHEKAKAAGWTGGRFQPESSQTPAGVQPDGGARPAAVQPATSSPDSGLRSTSDSSFSFGGEDSSARGVLTAFIVALNHHRKRLKPASEPIRQPALLHIGPNSPEGKAVEVIGRVPEADRYRLASCALEVLAFQVAAGERDFGDLRPGVLFGPAAFDQLVAAWPPKARAGPDRSRRGGATGSAPPSADLSATGTVDPNEIHLP